MSEYVFLGKIKNSNDRDCVKYMKFEGFECEHYFGGLVISGACFCGDLDNLRSNLDNFESILTKDELLKLFELSDKIKDLGYGIKKGDDKYNKGIEILSEYENTIGKKLLSEENKKLFEKVIEEEKEIMKAKWSLSDDDIRKIFECYDLDYRDRAIIGYVYDDAYELGESEFDNCYNIPENLIRYIDFEAFGNDLVDDRYYVELYDGRIVSLNY